MLYLVIEEKKNDSFVNEFHTEAEAVKFADEFWGDMCDADKKRNISFYVLKSANPDEEAENHFDGWIVRKYKYNGVDIINLIDLLFDYMVTTVSSWSDEAQRRFYTDDGYMACYVNDSSCILSGIGDATRHEIIDAVIELLKD